MRQCPPKLGCGRREKEINFPLLRKFYKKGRASGKERSCSRTYARIAGMEGPVVSFSGSFPANAILRNNLFVPHPLSHAGPMILWASLPRLNA